MPLLKIQSYPGIRQVLIAGEGIADLATVELLPGERQVRMGSTGNEHLAAGVARGAAVSGALVRVVTHGVVSGVIINAQVDAGDRLAIVTSGRVTPFNDITPTGAISGFVPINLVSGSMASGDVGVDLQALVCTSGPITGVTGAQFSSGALAGTAFNTGRVLGKALTSGLAAGSGIQMMVSLG